VVSQAESAAPDLAWEAEESTFECWLHHNHDELRGDYEGECKNFEPFRAPSFRQFAWERYLSDDQEGTR
jgi:hypothetical protein